MSDVAAFFSRLLDTNDWPPRWHCGTWTDFHGWLYIISDLLIWAAYSTIPIIIIRYLSIKRLHRFLWLYILFAAFILFCGASHFLDAITFWLPLYRLNALVKAVTAVVSVITAYYLIKLLPVAFSLQTPESLEAEIEMRKKAEKELLYKNEQMTDAEIIGNFGSYEWNTGTGEIFLSEGMKHLLGKPGPAALTYSEFLELMPEQEREAESKILQEFIAVKKYKAHYQTIVTPKGERVFFTRGREVIGENGELEKFIGTSHDVTDIKKNKELLDESRQTFKNAFDNSSVGMALVSTEGKWLNVNEAACDMLGYNKEELKELTFQQLTYNDDLEADVQQLQQILSRDIKSYRMEKRYLKKDGEILWALLSVSLVWKNNNPSFFISQIIDISLQKKLMQELEVKNLELTGANKKLEYHIGHVNEFNRIIAHNLRGPASTLINCAEFIAASESEEDKQFIVSRLKNTAEAIITTLNDLKEFIEIYINKKHVPAPGSFEDAFNKSLLLLTEQIQESKAVITTDFRAKTVNFPDAYLESMFYNLISNSIKYAKSSTVPVIQIKTWANDATTAMSITDNGIGIDLAKYKNDIFKYKKVFHKGFNSNGLGLFLTKNQVEAYGGQITIDSIVNEGTSFNIIFRN